MPRLSPKQIADRKSHILDAAEACFAEHGFHRTTMQDICRAARVSPGALYLYFPSKEALIAGLTERDRAMLTEGFRTILAAPDILAAFFAMSDKHMIEEPRSKALVVLSIWAEAARDPNITKICTDFDQDLKGHLRTLFLRMREQMIARGLIQSAISDVIFATQALEPLVDCFLTLIDGLFKRRALQDDFDVRRAMAMVRRILVVGFSGHLLPRMEPDEMPAAPPSPAQMESVK